MAPRLTDLADRDIAHILRETHRIFGPHHVAAYPSAIDKAVRMAGEDPGRPPSQSRSDLRSKVCSIHVELTAARRDGVLHMPNFTHEILSDGSREVIILRVLHDSREPRHRIARSLRHEDTCQHHTPSDIIT